MYHVSYKNDENDSGSWDLEDLDRVKRTVWHLNWIQDENIEVREVTQEQYLGIERMRLEGTPYEELYANVPMIEV